MKVKDIAKLFCTDKMLNNYVCINTQRGEVIYNIGDPLEDILDNLDLGELTVWHCWIADNVLYMDTFKPKKEQV